MLRCYLARVPSRSRPALYYQSFYSVGRGVFMPLWQLSLAALKGVLHGQLWHSALLGSIFGGAGLFAPLWTSRRVSMRTLVVRANMLAAVLLLLAAVPLGPTWFVFAMGVAFLAASASRVGEMSLYQVVYPATHRSSAVGMLQGIAFVSAGITTVAATWLFDAHAQGYWIVYLGAAVIMLAAALAYAQIPLRRSASLLSLETLPPHKALARSVGVLRSDRPFLLYQLGFFASGFAAHMSMPLVAEVLREELHASVLILGGALAVFPYLLQAVTAPFWGKYLDRVNPIVGRATFATFHMVTYGLYCFGGLSRQVWPFLVGGMVHGIATSGGQINWLTGSLYFARKDQHAVYNSLHVGLTGLRGLVAAWVGLWLYSIVGMGSWVFAIASGLCVLSLGSLVRLAVAQPAAQERGAAEPLGPAALPSAGPALLPEQSAATEPSRGP